MLALRNMKPMLFLLAHGLLPSIYLVYPALSRDHERLFSMNGPLDARYLTRFRVANYL